MRNRVKQFVDAQGITVYQFWKDTGISRTTAYALYNQPEQYPGRDVMDAICTRYRVQPSELLEWINDEVTITQSPDGDRPTRSRRSAETKPNSKAEFQPGQMVKNPAGWRGWITKLLDDGKAVVDWEGQINGDVIPLHLLRACE